MTVPDDVAAGDHPTAELYLHAYGEAADARTVKRHLDGCPACRATLAELSATREALDALPELDIADGRWEAMLHAATSGDATRRGASRTRTLATHRWLPWGIAAAAMIAVLFGAYSSGIRRGREDAARARREERAREVVALLREPRSADRLRGVSFGSGLVAGDARVASAFARALHDDPSPNVRLAVLDAFDAAPDRNEVVAQLVRALAREPFPAVRLAIIDLLVRLRDSRARGVLAGAARGDADATVRLHAASALTALDARTATESSGVRQ